MPESESDIPNIIVIPNKIVLTRYLYNKLDVLRSLRWAIFSQQIEEALFWAYEIYYSGFEEEIMGFIYTIGVKYYSNVSPKFKKIWNEWDIEWIRTKNIDLLPTMVLNLAKRQPSLIDSAQTRNEFRFIIRCKHSIRGRKYETRAEDGIPPYKVLPMVSMYSIRIREILAERGKTYTEYMEKTNDAYLNNWAYYAWRSPIWRQRFEAYGAKLHETEEKVVFANEEQEEEFMEKWNYEPDEQKIEIHNKHGIYFQPVEPYTHEEIQTILREKI